MPEHKTRPVEEMLEVELYFLIDQCGAFIWRMNHEISHGRIKDVAGVDKSVQNVRKQQAEAAEILNNRYGEGKFLQGETPTEEYYVWYKKWSAWHKGMTDKQWEEVDKILLIGISEKQENDFRNEAFNLGEENAKSKKEDTCQNSEESKGKEKEKTNL